MSVQVGGIVGSNVYRTEDAPLYKTGDTALFGVLGYDFLLISACIWYYKSRNCGRDCLWDAMSEDEKAHYLARNSEGGNKRMDFRFAS
ncbi:hypothetical protein MCOR25_008762 [Pyricularia grisea]|nr:hypothetical protein MCOR25_008762 [Pyricularia grisea]